MARRKRAPPDGPASGGQTSPQKERRKAQVKQEPQASPTRTLRSRKKPSEDTDGGTKVTEADTVPQKSGKRRASKKTSTGNVDTEGTPKTEVPSASKNQKSLSSDKKASRKSARNVDREGRASARYRAMEEADLKYLHSAQQAQTAITVTFTLKQLPNALGKLQSSPNPVSLEIPATADVQFLKRAIFYKAFYKLHPMFQVLRTGRGQVMEDKAADGTLRPVSHYGIKDGSQFEICIKIPEDDSIFEDLGGSPAEESTVFEGSMIPAGDSQGNKSKVRFTLEETEALIEGIETYGLTWKTIVLDPRLANRSNVHLKDRFRNLSKQVVKELEPRGMVLPYELKQRIRKLVEKYELGV